jgi:hypothetical protein
MNEDRLIGDNVEGLEVLRHLTAAAWREPWPTPIQRVLIRVDQLDLDA